MPMTPVWNDPHYHAFFHRADETIAEAQRQQAAPWQAEREERFHRMILEICGADAEDSAAAR